MRGGTLFILDHRVISQSQHCPPARGCHALRCLVKSCPNTNMAASLHPVKTHPPWCSGTTCRHWMDAEIWCWCPRNFLEITVNSFESTQAYFCPIEIWNCFDQIRIRPRWRSNFVAHILILYNHSVSQDWFRPQVRYRIYQWIEPETRYAAEKVEVCFESCRLTFLMNYFVFQGRYL